MPSCPHVLAPYDTRDGDPGAITTSALRQHAATHGLLDREEVIVLAGARTRVLPATLTPRQGDRSS